jgi:hypothetical protein
MNRRVQDRAERINGPQARLPVCTHSLALPHGRMVLGGEGNSRLIHYRPGDPRQALKVIELMGPLSCVPVAWREGFVSATNVGAVTLHDAEQGSPLGAGFQPELKPGRDYHWLEPAVFGAGPESQLLISDGAESLFLLTHRLQPQPHLAATTSADVGPSPLVTRLAVVGDRAFAGTEVGELARFKLPTLESEERIDVGGRISWGPYAMGDAVLIATQLNELALIGRDGTIRWRQPLKHGRVGGVPLVDGSSIYLLYPSAGLARVSLVDGAEAAFAELGQPAIAGPTPFGQRLLVAAFDGTLLVVNRP